MLISVIIFRQHLELPSGLQKSCMELLEPWTHGIPCLGSRQRLGKRRTIGADGRNNDRDGIKARAFLRSFPSKVTIRHGC
jgi:hypothetical protein